MELTYKLADTQEKKTFFNNKKNKSGLKNMLPFGFFAILLLLILYTFSSSQSESSVGEDIVQSQSSSIEEWKRDEVVKILERSKRNFVKKLSDFTEEDIRDLLEDIKDALDACNSSNDEEACKRAAKLLDLLRRIRGGKLTEQDYELLRWRLDTVQGMNDSTKEEILRLLREMIAKGDSYAIVVLTDYWTMVVRTGGQVSEEDMKELAGLEDKVLPEDLESFELGMAILFKDTYIHLYEALLKAKKSGGNKELKKEWRAMRDAIKKVGDPKFFLDELKEWYESIKGQSEGKIDARLKSKEPFQCPDGYGEDPDDLWWGF